MPPLRKLSKQQGGLGGGGCKGCGSSRGVKEVGFSQLWEPGCGGISPDKNEVIRRNTIHQEADITATCTNKKGGGCSIEPSSLRACTDNLTLISTKHCTHSTLSQVLQTSKVYQKLNRAMEKGKKKKKYMGSDREGWSATARGCCSSGFWSWHQLFSGL